MDTRFEETVYMKKIKIALKCRKRYLILLIRENKLQHQKDTTFCVLNWQKLKSLILIHHVEKEMKKK